MKRVHAGKAIIIGAGPAGLTAAYELLKNTNIKPIIFEADSIVGGLSKTVNYKGNRIDIGGHRFFSKSEKVNAWWFNFLSLQTKPAMDELLLNKAFDYKNLNGAADPTKDDNVMLRRSRLSRIFFLRRFFNYPISLSIQTFLNLGIIRMFKIGYSYLKVRLFPIKNERSLQDFFINRFGTELYNTFFKDYTEKVWGVPCNSIDASWGAQRIKGLSISKAVWHAFKSIFVLNSKKNIKSKNVETSLIDSFFYPKYGPGQMWETVASKVEKLGGKIYRDHEVLEINTTNNQLSSVTVLDKKNSNILKIDTDYLFSSMPIKNLINGLQTTIPTSVKTVSDGLVYRDFITVGILLSKLKIKNSTKIKTLNKIIPDNWIYIQERDVKVGRIQIFNNWSPYMLKNINNVWIGLEYFCQEGDELWSKSDSQFISMAIDELCKLEFIERDYVLDYTIVRAPKAYPAYFGTYSQFGLVKTFLDKFENLFLIGRNGMHRYNNMDHSMLSAMAAVENIVNGKKDKDNIWFVNAEKEYHEESSQY